ncbi:MAG: hypothetical protein E6R03_02685 [Hyphomicrobiaceae bacterium]|nr:MAG: hypothetical protein E6R03_02685 [Hyphomicrobiaceae bacterium]
MAGGFAKAAAVTAGQTLQSMAVGAGLLAGGTYAVGQIEKGMNAAANANREPQQAPPPLSPEEQAARQRLAEQHAWLQQQGGFSGLVEQQAAGGPAPTWDSGWMRTLQARGQVQ